MLENPIIPKKNYINTLSWVLSLPTKEALNLPPLQCLRKVCTSVGVSFNRRLSNRAAVFSILPKIKRANCPPTLPVPTALPLGAWASLRRDVDYCY